MRANPAASALVCAECRGDLDRGSAMLRCVRCRQAFPMEDGIADFTSGSHYDDFREGQPLPPEHLRALEDELAGTRTRIEGFYAPRLARRFGQKARVLDCGCGNGPAVDLLETLGFEAWGVDASALRKWQWRERQGKDRLAVADALKLPFADGYFDAVISSGVIEHIGVRETRSPVYAVRPEEDQTDRRRRYLTEILRVTRAGGVVWIDAPNGAFPIDFWHSGEMEGSSRFHWPTERFLPTPRGIRRLLESIPDRAAMRMVSPRGRFRFGRLRRRWYGRPASALLRALFRLLEVPPFDRLAGSPLNPYLVAEITKEAGAKSPAG